MDPFGGAGDWSRKSELDPHFLAFPRARFDMEFESGRGWPADGVTAFGVIWEVFGVWGAPTPALTPL